MKHYLIAGLFVVGAGCGYSANQLMAHRSVKLNIFDNIDERRTQEFDLTRAVARELQEHNIRLNGSDATAIVEGTIESITAPSVVEGKSDVVVVGAVTYKIQVVVKDMGGREISRREKVESATFATDRQESRETARQEVFDRLARWVASNLEKDW
jgi:hypothetical protein